MALPYGVSRAFVLRCMIAVAMYWMYKRRIAKWMEPRHRILVAREEDKNAMAVHKRIHPNVRPAVLPSPSLYSFLLLYMFKGSCTVHPFVGEPSSYFHFSALILAEHAIPMRMQSCSYVSRPLAHKYALPTARSFSPFLSFFLQFFENHQGHLAHKLTHALFTIPSFFFPVLQEQ